MVHFRWGTFLFFWFMLLIQFGSFAQSYTPIPLSTASWVGGEYYVFGQTVYADWLNRSNGDTVMNGYRYAHLVARTHWYGMPNEYIESNVYLRNDTLNKKVYIVRHGEFYERVLFDFNLQVGDTLQGYYRFTSGDSTMVFTVGSRSTIIVNGSPRLLIEIPFSPNRSLRWVEGVGSLGGMVFPEIAMFEGGSQLNCFYEDPATDPSPHIFFSMGYGACGLNVALNDHSSVSDVEIFSFSGTACQLNNQTGTALFLELFDYSGKLIFNKEVPLGLQEISFSSCSEGIFLCRISEIGGEPILIKRIFLSGVE